MQDAQHFLQAVYTPVDRGVTAPVRKRARDLLKSVGAVINTLWPAVTTSSNARLITSLR
ncbi:hypothetical protein [Undibacterium terreum]|uniref:hypothetical protein n=1 Tax=Undibacterium terreum TaxID=1224302 RepID=UPI001669B9FC|nr:hypothetical protein [Undibacterium terreum]